MLPTQKEIKTMRIKNLSTEQFLKILHLNFKYKNIQQVEAQLKKLKHGDFLGVWRNAQGKWYCLHLRKIFIKKFELPYRTTKTKNGKARVGKELIIGSMPLPRGKII